jgi:DNA repair protein RadC
MTQQHYTENTPGYPYRLQVVFTIKDGHTRAWLLSSLNGKAVLVPQPLDATKDLVGKGFADEVPMGTVADTQDYGRQVPYRSFLESKEGCGCKHNPHGGRETDVTLGAVDVEAAVAQKKIELTETVIVGAGRGRLVTGSTAGEPLMAVAEGSENRVACCGRCPDGGGSPNAIVFDRYKSGEGGAYGVSESVEYKMPRKLAREYESPHKPTCLPWVRIARDPERFRECLAAARQLGPISDSSVPARLVGNYLLQQDQEVFLVIMLDGQMQVRGISEVARGARDKVDVPVPDVLRIAIVDGSMGIIVCHNHPSGVTKPSDADKELTTTIKKACEEVHLYLMDHVILAGDDYFSFAEKGYLR